VAQDGSIGDADRDVMPAPVFGPIVRSDAGQSDDDFDYACGVARADAIDQILLQAIEDRGWDVFDPWVLERVCVEHDGKTRVRVLIDGNPVTPWWDDHLTVENGWATWRYQRVD
jgi:hypothetical protein